MGLGAFLSTHLLLVGLVAAVIFGLLWPAAGVALAGPSIWDLNVTDAAIVICFLVNGLTLKLGEIAQARGDVAVVGLALILGVTPLLALVLLFANSHVPLAISDDTVQGFALFCVVPTTTASGVLMVSQVEGNTSVAVLLTVVSNALAVFTLPFWIQYILSARVHLGALPVLLSLVFRVLAPMALGVIARWTIPRVAGIVEAAKAELRICNIACVVLVVWVIVSRAQGAIFEMRLFNLGVCVTLAVGVHLVFLMVCAATTSLLSMSRREARTLILMGSQKSLPVCLSVLATPVVSRIPGIGALLIPCIMGHTIQLLLDSGVVWWWQQQECAEDDPLMAGKADGNDVADNPQC